MHRLGTSYKGVCDKAIILTENYVVHMLHIHSRLHAIHAFWCGPKCGRNDGNGNRSQAAESVMKIRVYIALRQDE